MKSLRHVFLLLLCCVPLFAGAAEVSELYSSKVEVSATNNAWLNQRKALSEVLVKISGNSAVLKNEVIKKALQRARDYIVKQGEVTLDGQKYFQAQFNKEKINQLLRTSHFGIWGKKRPQQVIWLVVDENFQRSVRGELDTDYAPFIDAVKQHSHTRAVPMLFPLMDLDDDMMINSSDLWGQFTDPVAQASQRYGADNFVIAKIIKNRQDYQINWSLYGRNSKSQPYDIWLNGNFQGQLEELGYSLSEKVANFLGSRYSVKDSGSNEQLLLTIDRVNSVSSYARLMKLLAAMPAIASVELASVRGSSVELNVTLIGSRTDLEQEISLEPNLRVIQDELGDRSYEWSGR